MVVHNVEMTVRADPASDAWGFVGVVCMGELEAYRTVEAYATPGEAIREVQSLLGTVLGEMLAGAEWRRVRERTGASPTRRDLSLSVLQHPRNHGGRVIEPDAAHVGQLD